MPNTTERWSRRSSMAAATIWSSPKTFPSWRCPDCGQADGAFEVALRLEDGGGRFGGQGQVAQLVDDEQLAVAQWRIMVAQRLLDGGPMAAAARSAAVV